MYFSLSKGSGNEPLSKNTADPLPTISPQHVKQILDAACFAHPLPPTPLQSSIFFQTYVQEQVTLKVSPSTTLEDFLLLEWLNDHICNGLNRHRTFFGLDAPICNASLKQSLAELSRDFRQNAVELEAWSVLYFRYVRVEWQLSWQQFAAATAQEERTLRRRQQRGILRLTHALICEDLAVLRSAQSALRPIAG